MQDVSAPRNDSADLGPLLERLLQVLEIPPAALETIRQALFRHSAESVTSLGDLRRSLAQAGLRVGAAFVPPAEIPRLVAPEQPILFAVPDDKGSRFVLVSASRGDAVYVEGPVEGKGHWVAISTLVGPNTQELHEVVTVDAPLGPGRSSDGHDHHEHLSPRERLWALIRQERHDLAAILVYALFLGLFTLALPVAVQALVNTVAFGTLLQPLVVLTILLFAALAFSATLRGLQMFVVEIVQKRIFVRIVLDLAHRLPRVKRETFDRLDGPELANRFFDTFTVQKAVAILLLDGLEISLTILVGMVALAFYHPLLLAFDLLLLCALLAIAFGMGRRAVDTAIEESKHKYELGAWFQETVRHDGLFKLGGLRFAEQRAESLARAYLRGRQAHFGLVFRQTVAVLSLQAIANACLLGIGGWLVIQRQLTLGQLIAAELIVTTIVASLAKVGKYLESYYDLLAALDKVGHLTDLPTEREGGVRCDEAFGSQGAHVVVEALKGSYSGGADVLKGLNLELLPGARVSVTGPNGSGKSLLGELMVGLRAPSEGRLLVNGLDLRDVDLASFRENVSLVRPETIPGSILQNLSLGRRTIDASRARHALELVSLRAEIELLPDGLNAELNRSGEPLTAGQKLRLSVARAIIHEPALIVIDAAIDDLDPVVRDPLLDLLFDAERPWTLLVLTNDELVQKRCATQYVIADGLLREVA